NEYKQCDVPEPNSQFIAVSASISTSVGLRADGSVVAWGRNTYGQCNPPRPNTGFVAIAAGGSRTLAIQGCRFGDINCDEIVNVIDLLEIIDAWGPCPVTCTFCFADINHDCIVDVSDLLAL